jgi:electron transfer flavoprotein alpha subunit
MVLAIIDHADGNIKKATNEVVSYAAALAQQMGTTCEALALGAVVNHEEQLAELGKYGAQKVHFNSNEAFNTMDAQVHTAAIAEAAGQLGAQVLVLSHNSTGKSIAPRLSVRLNAGLVSSATALPDLSNGFVVKKNVFSGKAYAHVGINTATKIISLSPNSFGVNKIDKSAAVSAISLTVPTPRIKVTATNKVTGTVPLSEAELVISGGRGLKGPENWYLVEDLAKEIGAATACSRAVADAHWRPHHEHVGQTGGAVAPNLYFAIGISGAIQHLAGVNRSKVIVVVNKDPEAPFFKAADYGIVGDAFEVMPKIVEAVRKLKASN